MIELLGIEIGQQALLIGIVTGLALCVRSRVRADLPVDRGVELRTERWGYSDSPCSCSHHELRTELVARLCARHRLMCRKPAQLQN